MRLKADCCYCFEVSGYPDEARSMKHQFLVEFLKQVADYYSFIVVSFWWLNNSYSLNVITTVWMECIIWESSNLIKCLSYSVCVQHGWIKFNVSDAQNFWRAKRVCYQFCSEIYSLQEQIHEHYRFFKNGKTKTRSRFAPLSQVDCLTHSLLEILPENAFWS